MVWQTHSYYEVAQKFVNLLTSILTRIVGSFGGDEGNRTPVLTFFNAQVLQAYPELMLKGGTLARTNPF